MQLYSDLQSHRDQLSANQDGLTPGYAQIETNLDEEESANPKVSLALKANLEALRSELHRATDPQAAKRFRQNDWINPLPQPYPSQRNSRINKKRIALDPFSPEAILRSYKKRVKQLTIDWDQVRLHEANPEFIEQNPTPERVALLKAELASLKARRIKKRTPHHDSAVHINPRNAEFNAKMYKVNRLHYAGTVSQKKFRLYL